MINRFLYPVYGIMSSFYAIMLDMEASTPNQVDQDLLFYYCGQEQCASGHSWKSIRDHYLLHYIVRGKGTVRFGQAEYSLGPGDGFAFFPGTLCDYRADTQQPWEYLWCGFAGRSAEYLLAKIGLSRENGIYTAHDPDRLAPLLGEEVTRLAATDNFFLHMSGLYRFLYLLEEYSARRPVLPVMNRAPQNYIDAVTEYIRTGFSRPSCSVSEMAQRLGLNRSYLSQLVRSETGKTPQELIYTFRMYRAREYLSTTGVSIAEVAALVGYADQLTFSKAFHRWAGVSPREYRKSAVPRQIVDEA